MGLAGILLTLSILKDHWEVSLNCGWRNVQEHYTEIYMKHITVWTVQHLWVFKFQALVLVWHCMWNFASTRFEIRWSTLMRFWGFVGVHLALNRWVWVLVCMLYDLCLSMSDVGLSWVVVTTSSVHSTSQYGWCAILSTSTLLPIRYSLPSIFVLLLFILFLFITPFCWSFLSINVF